MDAFFQMSDTKYKYSFSCDPGMYRFEDLSMCAFVPADAVEASKHVSYDDNDVIVMTYPKSGLSCHFLGFILGLKGNGTVLLSPVLFLFGVPCVSS